MRKWIPVLAAAALAVLSALLRHPTGEMIVAMPWKGIFIILMLLACYAGLEREKAFSGVRRAMSGASTVFGAMALSVSAATVIAPFITSYMASLAIIPLIPIALHDAEKDRYIPRTIAFTAIGATIGGFLLPAGSFHNLFLAEGFSSIRTMALPSAIAILLLLAVMALSMGKGIREKIYIHPELETPERNRSLLIFYICLTAVTMLASVGIFTWLDILIFCIVLTLLFDRTIYKSIDYRMFIFIVLLSFALTPFRTETSPWIAYALSELIGGTASALISVPSETALKAVNLGSLGLMASFPAAAGLIQARKLGKAKEYILWYMPAALAISLLLMILPF